MMNKLGQPTSTVPTTSPYPTTPPQPPEIAYVG
jgi:hypothetical protein